MQDLPMPLEVPQHLLRRAGDEISTLRTATQIGPDAWEIECDSSAFDLKRACLGRPLLFHSSAVVRLIVDRELSPTDEMNSGISLTGHPLPIPEIFSLRYRCMSSACAHKAPLRLGTMRLRRGRWLPTLERFFFSPPPSPQRSPSPGEWGDTAPPRDDETSEEANLFDPRFSPLTALISVATRRQRQLDL